MAVWTARAFLANLPRRHWQESQNHASGSETFTANHSDRVIAGCPLSPDYQGARHRYNGLA